MAILGFAILLVAVSCSVICWQKGKRWLALFSLLGIGFAWAVVGAIRLAKPESPWARARYDDDKRRRADERFNDEMSVAARSVRAEDMAGVASSRTDEDVDLYEIDPITRRALNKARRQ